MKSKFWMLECKIQTTQTLGDKIQILKLHDVKSKHPQTLWVWFAIYPKIKMQMGISLRKAREFGK